MLATSKKYPDRCAVYVQKAIKCNKNTPNINKNKFLVPYGTQYGQFIHILRKNMQKLKPSEAIFTYINGTYIPCTSDTFNNLFSYHAVKNTDGVKLFLYIVYAGENTFGNLISSFIRT